MKPHDLATIEAWDRRNAYREGQRWMRDHVIDEFVMYATTHPDPVVTDELWAYVHRLRAMEVNQ